MSPYSVSLLLLGGAAFFAGCSDGGTGPILPPSTDCADVAPTSLAVGAHTVIDAAQTPCVRLPAAGSGGAEYIYAALATDATETDSGVTADYKLQGNGSGTAVVASAARVRSGPQKTNVPAAFHAMLRARERALSERAGAASFARGTAAALVAPTPPTVGDKRNFEVCSTTDCDAFVTRPATARVVGERVAIFLDDTVPSGGYTQADLDKVGELFDSHPTSPETQWVENTSSLIHDDHAVWRWSVTPQRSGSGRLVIMVSARTIGHDGVAADTAPPDRVIDIKVRGNPLRRLGRWTAWMVVVAFGAAAGRFGPQLWDAGAQAVRMVAGW